MSQMTGGNTTNFTGSYELRQRTGTKITFDTDGKYVKQDIEFTVDAQSATPSFNGGSISGSATGTYTNATTSNTNTSGVAVVADATASCTAVLYNGAVNGWVTAANGDSVAVTGLQNQTLTSETKYITGVQIETSKAFTVTVPNGGTTPSLPFTFTVDGSGNVTIS